MPFTSNMLRILLLAVSVAAPVLAHGQALINSYVFGGGGASSTLNNGLVAYWKMDEAANATRVDSENSGTDYDLTNNDSVGATTGKINNAADFSGDAGTDYLSHVDTTGLEFPTGGMTISVWLNSGDFTADRAFVGKFTSTGDQREYMLWFSPSRFRFRTSAAGTSTAIEAVANTFGAPSTSTTYMVTGGFDDTGDVNWIQVNAGTRDTVANTGSIFTGTSPFFVGVHSGGTFAKYNGWIDEVAIWNRSLSTTEVTELYNAGSGKTCCPFAP